MMTKASVKQSGGSWMAKDGRGTAGNEDDNNDSEEEELQTPRGEVCGRRSTAGRPFAFAIVWWRGRGGRTAAHTARPWTELRHAWHVLADDRGAREG